MPVKALWEDILNKNVTKKQRMTSKTHWHDATAFKSIEMMPKTIKASSLAIEILSSLRRGNVYWWQSACILLHTSTRPWDWTSCFKACWDHRWGSARLRSKDSHSVQFKSPPIIPKVLQATAVQSVNSNGSQKQNLSFQVSIMTSAKYSSILGHCWLHYVVEHRDVVRADILFTLIVYLLLLFW